MGKKIFTIGFLAVVVFVLSACASEPPAPPVLLQPVIADILFDTEIVSRGLVADITLREAIIRRDTVPLNFGAAAGLFGAYKVQPGDVVQAGQILAQLDDEWLVEQIELHDMRITTMRQRHVLDNRLHTNNLEMLIARNDILTRENINESHIQREQRMQEIERSRLELDFMVQAQQLELRNAENERAILATQREESKLVAPFNGTVVYLAGRSRGSWVSPFEPMVYIVSEDAVLFAEYIGTAVFTPRVTDRIVAHVDGRVYDVTRLYLTREQLLRYQRAPIRFILETEVPPPVGSFVALYVYSNQMEDVLRIPRHALFHDPGVGFFVYKMIDGQRTQVLITIGIQTETYVAVLGGLEAGDEVYVRR